MKLNDAKLKDILLKENYVSAADLSKAEAFAREHRLPMLEYLFTEKLITKDLLGQAIAEFYGVPYADLNSLQPAKEQVIMMPEATAIKFHAVPFRVDDKEAIITTDDPDQEFLLQEMKALFQGKKVSINYSLSEDIDSSFIAYQKALDTRFAKIIREKQRIAPEIIDEIFDDASAFRASDIHFEPQDKDVVVRFRVDGVLYEAGRIPLEFYANILNRVKVQAHLRIDEHYAAQDGAIRSMKGDKEIDMRVSIAPTLSGEKIVLRMLSEYVRSFALGDLGLSAKDQEMIEEVSKKPFGMILVTGPTGSGKTTTLYGVLKLLNRPEVNITTIEDPVEYKVTGVNHIQVNPQTNLTFAKGLRSIVRQDPDIILVGEIRDQETAEIAINAALTGHVLLSTFHANDAATAIPRLLDMGAEPFLLASTLEVVLAQRLVRKICENCRTSVTMKKTQITKKYPIAAHYFPESSYTLYEGKGCALCGHTGYKGRTAIFEFIRITPEMQDLVLTNPSTKQIWEIAKKQGAHTLFDDGVIKVKQGLTTIEELLRVATPPLV
jgi:type IV pilus assembly protein PilB